MPADSKRVAASKAVSAAQRQFERDSKAAHEARRKAFAQAQKDGLSLREISEIVGLDHTRIHRIIPRTTPRKRKVPISRGKAMPEEGLEPPTRGL